MAFWIDRLLVAMMLVLLFAMPAALLVIGILMAMGKFKWGPRKSQEGFSEIPSWGQRWMGTVFRLGGWAIVAGVLFFLIYVVLFR